MAFSTPYTFTALELLTAAKMNAIQTNITAIWAGTAAGDVDYYASATTKGRIAKPAALSMLTNDSTGVPAWATGGRVHAIGFDESTTLTSSNNALGVPITGLTLDLTLTQTCTVMLWMWASVNASVGDTPTQAAMLLGSIGGTAQTYDNSTPRSYEQSYRPIASMQVRTGVTSGTVTCLAKIATTEASRQADALGGKILAIAVTE